MAKSHFFFFGAALLLCGCENIHTFRSLERAPQHGAFNLDVAAAGYTVPVTSFPVRGETSSLCLGAEGDLRDSRFYAGLRGCYQDGVVKGSRTYNVGAHGETASLRLVDRSQAVGSTWLHVGYKVTPRLHVKAVYGLTVANFTLSGQAQIGPHRWYDNVSGIAPGHTAGADVVYRLTPRTSLEAGYAVTMYTGVDDKSFKEFPFEVRARQHTSGIRFGLTHKF